MSIKQNERLVTYVNAIKNYRLDKDQLMSKLKLLRQQINPTINWINSHWAILVLCVLIMGFLIARYEYNIALFQPFEEIADRQKEFKRQIIEREHYQSLKSFQQRMVERHLKLGDAFLYDEHYQAAAKQFKNALKTDKLNSEAQMGLLITDIYLMLKNKIYTPDIIRKQIYFIVSDASVNEGYRYLKPKAHANVLYGNLYSWLEKFGTAKAYYYKALQIDQKASSAYFGLGFICQKEDMIDQSLYFYQKAIEQSNWNEKYLSHLANAYSYIKQYGKAIENYELILSLDKAYLNPYCKIAYIYSLKNNPGMAVSYLERLINMLNDKTYTSIKKNQETWIVGKTNYLHTIDEKKFYVLKCFAAALRALNEIEFAQAMENTADALPIENKEMINKIMVFKAQ